MRNALFSLLAVFVLSGCGLISAVEDATPAQKAVVIKTTASLATSRGLIHGYDENEAEKQEATATLIYATVDVLRVIMEADENGVQIGDLREILSLFTFDELDLPIEVKIALDGAVALVQSYVRDVALGELLTSEERLYLDAFLDGVQEGAAAFLDELPQVETVQ